MEQGAQTMIGELEGRLHWHWMQIFDEDKREFFMRVNKALVEHGFF